MSNRSYGISLALTSGAAAVAEYINDKLISGILVVATVAGNVTVTLTGGSVVTFAVPVGTTILDLGVIRVNSATATATYYALA